MNRPPQSDGPEQRLLRLLALKRHELPPPGFFDRLPGRILVSIRAGSEVADVPWWSRLWQSIRQEPMVSASYAALGVGVMLFGFSVFETARESAPATFSLQGTATSTAFSLPTSGTHLPASFARGTQADPPNWWRAEAWPTTWTTVVLEQDSSSGPILISLPPRSRADR